MSIPEYAAMAMQGFLSSSRQYRGEAGDTKGGVIAKLSFDVAEAMKAEEEKRTFNCEHSPKLALEQKCPICNLL